MFNCTAGPGAGCGSKIYFTASNLFPFLPSTSISLIEKKNYGYFTH